MNPDKLENFKRAFSSNCSGCRRVCRCGREFYDFENHWDWEQGEIEKLDADKNATGLPNSVGTVRFQGREYVADCDCWHQEAEGLVAFVDFNASQIARYLNLEKERLTWIAKNAASVEETPS